MLFFASILAHELSHAFVARHYGVGTTSIDLWALGGVARLEHEPRTARAEGWIAAAGPLASLAIGVLSYGAALLIHRAGGPDGVVDVLAWLGIVNGILAVFNMLPGCTARRRSGRAGDPLGSPRRPLPGDARGRAGRTRASAGASPPSACR